MRLESPAVVAGAAVGIVAIAAAVLVGYATGAVGGSARAYLILPLVELGLMGVFTGGWLAALRCRRSPLVHGVVAALAALAVCAGAAVLVGLAGGEEVRWAAVALWLLLAVGAAAAGLGGLAGRGRSQASPTGPREADSPG